MVYRRHFISLILLLVLKNVAVAQTAKFKWIGDFCDREGTYRSSDHSSSQIKDAYRLAITDEFDPTSGMSLPFSIEDLDRLSVDDLDKEIQTKMRNIATLDLPKRAFWENLRKQKIELLNSYYKLRKATVLGYTDPSALNEIAQNDPVLLRYANALNAGGEELINMWKEVNQSLQLKNGNPQLVRSRFDQQNLSTDRSKYAIIEILTFGWWNHANRSVQYLNGSEGQENFTKLFIRIKNTNCSEP